MNTSGKDKSLKMEGKGCDKPSGNSVGIIGMGWVGSSIAISLLQNGIAEELLVNDIREGIAEGEAIDLSHGASFLPSAKVRAAGIGEMKNCRIIAVTAGRGGRPGESRPELLKENIEIARKISTGLQDYKGLLIVVSNPVDALTHFYRLFTGLPSHRVIGTGTFLDSARLRRIIGSRLDVDAKSIHADVIGEHGDSSVIMWSAAKIGSIALRNWQGWQREYESETEAAVRNAAQEVIKRKGATNHAIGLVTAKLIKWLLRDDRRVVTLSTGLSGQYGLGNTCLSLPCLISASGIERIVCPVLDPEESEKLKASAAMIRKSVESAT